MQNLVAFSEYMNFKRGLSFMSFLPKLNETLSAKLIMTVLQHQFCVDFGRGKLKTSFLTSNSSKDTEDKLYLTLVVTINTLI